ncbi:Cro/C1-type helix-turn-helix domain [Caulobacteraceae bacterium]
MSPIRFVRSVVLGLTQAEFARLLGVREAAVSKWETGRVVDLPIGSKIRPAVLKIVEERGLPWQDSWLFEVPVCDACVGADGCASGCRRLVELCIGHEANQSHIEAIGNGNLAPKISPKVPS